MAEERLPLLTSRQLAAAAVFGGLGFAWRALGLVIPIAPPFVVDLRQVLIIIGAAAAGPYGSMIIAVLFALPSALPVADIFYYGWQGLIFCIFYKRLYYMKSRLRWVLLSVLIGFLAFSANAFMSMAISSFVFRLFPYWPMFLTTWVFPGIGYTWVIFEIVGFLVTARGAPRLIVPTWSWTRPKAKVGS